MIDLIFLSIIALLLFHYIYFLILIYSGLKKLQISKNKSIPKEFVSVIIPFRNEADNILKSLESISTQDYPENQYEVIYVNDRSTDNSLQIITSANRKENIKILTVPDDFSKNAHKKRAIRYGLTFAKGEIIVTTDADCIHKNNWLSSLLSFMDEETAFISGPVEFSDSDTIFKRIQKLEFAGLIITGAGLIGAGHPIICNAANIAYKKRIFDQVGGFSYQMDLSSGDDELLMQKIHQDTDYKIQFALNKDAVVSTSANDSINSFYQQRKRWASKGLFYKNKILVLKLILIFLFYLGLILQLAAGIFISKIYLLSFLLSLVMKITLEYLLLRKGVSLLFQKNLLKNFLVTEIFQIPYIILAGLAGTIGGFEWKGRKVKR